MRERGRFRRRRLVAAAANEVGEDVSDHPRYRSYLEGYFYQLSRPAYGLIHRVVAWLIFYYAFRTLFVWIEWGIEPNEHYKLIDYMYYNQSLFSFMMNIAMICALGATWLYIVVRRWFDWDWDEVIDEMFDPENLERLQEADQLARKQIRTEQNAEQIKDKIQKAGEEQ